MSQPYVGEIRMFGGSFAPAGWAFCAGQLLPISENETLFNLIGTTYGGDGQSTFGLPDLQGRVPVHAGTGGGGTYTLGETGGTESVTLTTQQLPSHNHLVSSTTGGGVGTPGPTTIMADQTPPSALVSAYLPFNNVTQVALRNTIVGLTGGNQPHDNMQPFLVVSYIISLFGIFPSQN
ncbi:MAG TPA: tail fiber protein [Xanthobacteraceae bacterium]|nr:tail fiber protein [Xanthobacteraceae bacterium]